MGQLRAGILAVAVAAVWLGGLASVARADGSVSDAARVGFAPPSQRLSLLIPLRGRDAALRRFAREVTDPASPLYGGYQPVSVLARRFGASLRARAAVTRYLRASGGRDVFVDATGLFVHLTITATRAQRLFGTQLAEFASAGGRFVAPAASVHVPRRLSGLIEGVVGLDTRRVMGHPAVQPSSAYFPATGTPKGCPAGVGTGGFTPNQYRTAYDYSPLYAAGLTGAGERVALIEIDGFRYSDLTAFARCFGLDVPAETTYLVGIRHALPPGAETTLDLEVLDSVAPDLAGLDVFESDGNSASVLRAYLAPLLYPNAKPQIISTSVGLCERFSDETDNGAAVRSAERTFQLLASTGVTVLAAAGDNGSADCAAGEPRPPAPDRRLAVDFPASSPWVTGVGGTQLFLNPDNHIQRQLVWNDAGQHPMSAGGGGRSRLFARPAYQRGVVTGDRRVVPDVSALADPAPGYATYCSAPDCGIGSRWSTVGGTSAATPLLAGGVALVEQDLRQHGRKAIGFMNPLLYGLARTDPRVFSDVTAYGNDVGPFIPGGNHGPLGCCTATVGFDPASGWGSVDLAQLDADAMTILPRVPSLWLSVPPGEHPINARRIVVTLRCSTSCRALSFALVAIPGAKVFEVRSSPVAIPGHVPRRVALSLSRSQDHRLRRALQHGKRIFAEAFGVLVDAQGSVLAVTPARRVPIAS